MNTHSNMAKAATGSGDDGAMLTLSSPAALAIALNLAWIEAAALLGPAAAVVWAIVIFAFVVPYLRAARAVANPVTVDAAPTKAQAALAWSARIGGAALAAAVALAGTAIAANTLALSADRNQQILIAAGFLLVAAASQMLGRAVRRAMEIAGAVAWSAAGIMIVVIGYLTVRETGSASAGLPFWEYNDGSIAFAPLFVFALASLPLAFNRRSATPKYGFNIGLVVGIVAFFVGVALAFPSIVAPHMNGPHVGLTRAVHLYASRTDAQWAPNVFGALIVIGTFAQIAVLASRSMRLEPVFVPANNGLTTTPDMMMPKPFLLLFGALAIVLLRVSLLREEVIAACLFLINVGGSLLLITLMYPLWIALFQRRMLTAIPALALAIAALVFTLEPPPQAVDATAFSLRQIGAFLICVISAIALGAWSRRARAGVAPRH